MQQGPHGGGVIRDQRVAGMTSGDESAKAPQAGSSLAAGVGTSVSSLSVDSSHESQLPPEVRRLMGRRTELLQSGAYGEDDALIVKIDERVQQLLVGTSP